MDDLTKLEILKAAATLSQENPEHLNLNIGLVLAAFRDEDLWKAPPTEPTKIHPGLAERMKARR
jgi:hypothetical protein